MILFGCLLALGAAVAPRVFLIMAWIFADRWVEVWQGDFLLPLMGIIFLPYTTIMYTLSVVVLPGGETVIVGFVWGWILLGLILDSMKWGQVLANRKELLRQTAKCYPSDRVYFVEESNVTGSSTPGRTATSSKAADSDTYDTASDSKTDESSLPSG